VRHGGGGGGGGGGSGRSTRPRSVAVQVVYLKGKTFESGFSLYRCKG
jgi:hypothetical protein